MASKPRRALRIEELEAENIALRARLDMDAPDEQTWGANAPQELRDQMAASALFAEKLDEHNALRRLGFDPGPRDWTAPTYKDSRALAARIFGTPGVRAILTRDLEDESANRRMVVMNLLQIAEHGSDGEKVRAAQTLAKYNDWNEGDKSIARNGAASFNLFMANGGASPSQNGNGAKVVGAATALPAGGDIIDAEDFLAHEPSVEGVVVADDVAVQAEE